MAYGIIKVDTITFTDGGIDKSVTISGLVQNPTFSGNITVTGTISGNLVKGQTISGVTVTGTTAAFTTGTFISLTGTTIQGTTATYTTGSFTSLTGTTTTGTTANFASGVFTTQISGATITGNAASFTTVTGGTATLTSGVFASGTAAAPSVSVGTTDNGIYSPGADQVAISTNGTGRLFIDASGRVGVGTSAPLHNLQVGATTSAGSQAISIMTDDSGTGELRFSDATDFNQGMIQYSHSSDYMMFQVNNSERLRITSAGLVGIGASDPTEFLDLRRANGTGNLGIRLVQVGQVEYKIGINDSDDKLYITNNNGDAAIGANTKGIVITPTGAVGIGTTSPGDYDLGADDLVVANSGNGGVSIITGTSSVGALYFGDGTTSNQPYRGRIEYKHAEDSLNFGSAGTLRATIDSSGTFHVVGAGTGGVNYAASFSGSAPVNSLNLDSSGRLLVGASSSIQGLFTNYASCQFNATHSVQTASFSRFTNNEYGSDVDFLKSRSSTTGGHTILQVNDQISNLNFGGSDGSKFVHAATISALVDGTPGTDDMPGRLVFSVTADGASSPTEAMRIKNSRILNFANTPVYADNAAAKTGGLVDGDVYRKSDGTLMIVYT